MGGSRRGGSLGIWSMQADEAHAGLATTWRRDEWEEPSSLSALLRCGVNSNECNLDDADDHGVCGVCGGYGYFKIVQAPYSASA